jgi:hypothetical protein
MYIDDIRVFKGHEGMWLRVVQTDTQYYPKGFETKVINADADGFTTADKEGDIDTWDGAREGGLLDGDVLVVFEWVLEVPRVTRSSPTSRRKIADSIKVNLCTFLAAVSEAEKLGMEVCLQNIKEGVKITFDPPQEEY